MDKAVMDRRGFLGRGLSVGCSLAASPLMTPVSFAATGGENRLVVIILRGGLDGLDLVQPDDAALRQLRPTLLAGPRSGLELTEGMMLHAAAKPLWPLWQAGELAFVQGVSTPYRNKRSHFDGQDLLEAGTIEVPSGTGRDGWLNRMLQTMPNSTMTTAYAVGADPMLLSQGAAEVETWSPDVGFVLSSQGARLLELTMERDPEMALAMQKAILLAGEDGGGVFEASDGGMMADELDTMMDAQMNPKGRGRANAHLRVASFAAQQLRDAARVACFSIGGWDTHAAQARTLKTPLKHLSDSLRALKNGMGPDVWARTTVLAMTEFGRTVAENGTKGTDHGTGGLMVMAGGAIRGQKVHGQLAGFEEADLFQRRDLMPTDDVRRYAAWAIRESFGLDRSALEGVVFPGMQLGNAPGLLA
ncbi:MAG: DUF1501 domain-containing protein [Shimia sp.]|uniref:DUF1501 domain-containing protein n=1 Tax=Shimia sp. TaxID=1954381 RepID=UPI0025F7F630|nr:DUF1501 domain-containing protein [Shimia sp.]MCH2068746.1 DUF1501 domain-containing protein [Shimia sp.]